MERGPLWNHYKKTAYITLAMDGQQEVEDEGDKFHMEYEMLLGEGRFLSESSFAKMTGKQVEVPKGRYLSIGDNEGNAMYSNDQATLLTNMTTKKQMKTRFGGTVGYGLLYSGKQFYLLDNQDYQAIAKGISNEWKEGLTFFNIKSGDSYSFARSLYYGFINSMDGKYAMPTYYDCVVKYRMNQKDQVYWGDTDQMTKLAYDKPDSNEFRQYWSFMPKIRVLDQNDFMKTFAVFLMMFLFIAIVCMLSALVICYTRCVTIAINNRYVFDDLKRLGASPGFLNRELKSQARKVFTVPAIVGMSMMCLLYTMMLYANDGKLSLGEATGLGVCLAVVAGFGLVIFAVYRATVSKMRKQLGISRG